MRRILLLLIATFTLSCCSDDDNNTALPPATQTGAGTFACYVNGAPFIDKSGGWFNCYYQFVNGEYYFSIGGNDESIRPWSILLQTEKKEIFEGETYQLLELQDGNASGGGGFPEQLTVVYTNSEYSGELTITKLDFENNIVSGTFWFDIQHPATGERIEVREGRFDTLFTQ